MACTWFHSRLAVPARETAGGCAPTSSATTGANQNFLMGLLSMDRWTRWDHERQTDSLRPPLSIDDPFDDKVEPVQTGSERYARHLADAAAKLAALLANA
jgi:hypothetical protein